MSRYGGAVGSKRAPGCCDGGDDGGEDLEGSRWALGLDRLESVGE